MSHALTLQNLLEQGTIALWILIGISIVIIAFIIERAIFYFKRNINAYEFFLVVKEFIKQNRYKEAIIYCEAKSHHLTNMIKAGLSRLITKNNLKNNGDIDWDKVQLSDIESAMDASKIEEKLKLEKYTIVLATFGNISPFIGLFGTVWGIMKAFQKLALTENISPGIVMGEISEALIATAFGIAIAIPSVMFYNLYSRKIVSSLSDMDVLSSNYLQLLKVLKQNDGKIPTDYYFEEINEEDK